MIKKVLYLVLLFCASSAYAVVEHTGLWTGFSVVGPARFGPTIRYYYDGQLQLIDDQYKFDEVYGSIGIGNQVNDEWLLFLVNTFSVLESGPQITYDDKLYEEANWRKTFANNNVMAIRSRLEERVRFSASGMNLRLRERLMLRFPISWWPDHAYVFYDEVFFNLTRPDWVSNRVFEQNRFFVGIGVVVSKKLTVDIGYLNKLNFGSPDQMTNILLISFNFSGPSHYIKE